MSGNILRHVDGDISDDGAGIDEHELAKDQGEKTAREDAKNQEQSRNHSGGTWKQKSMNKVKIR